jgi:cytochrome c oxidase cbb3-type subunit 3
MAALLSAFTALSMAAGAQDTNPFANDPSAGEVGKGTFRIYCSPCHGMRAQGGRSGPDLTRGAFHAGSSDADLFRVISNGVPGTEMQAFTGTFPDSSIWRMISFLRASSVQHRGAPPEGNAAHGEELFWGKGGCGGCHAMGDHGMRLGPDLSRVGARQSAAQIRQTIVDPNANRSSGYRVITIQTRDGRSITGLQRSADDFSILLFDRAGKFHSFKRAELQSVVEEKVSWMPAIYGSLFTGPELDDLVAFLANGVAHP